MAENLSNTGYRPDAWGAPSAGVVTEQATIGASIVIKGEVSGSEPLFIDGTVEGLVHCPEHRVTIGRNSTVKADIQAREVAVIGSVKGKHPLQRPGGPARGKQYSGRDRNAADPYRRRCRAEG